MNRSKGLSASQARCWLTGALLPLAVAAASLPARADSAPAQNHRARVNAILKRMPVIDGHNDLPWTLRRNHGSKMWDVDLASDTRKLASPLQTDIPRLREGGVGGQFWSAWVPPGLSEAESVRTTVEQIDLIKEITRRYPKHLEMAYTAADIQRIYRSGKVASLIGIEGGHQIGNSLSTLRQLYELGARYITLTHVLNTDWADSATSDPQHGGLSKFGEAVVQEMNRLGMLVDLSHVSAETMRDALRISRSPVIYSHSSAAAIADHPRNVPDDVLRLVAKNGGIVMMNFYPAYVSEALRVWTAERHAATARFSTPPISGLYIGQPERAKAAMVDWEAKHPQPVATLAQVADHIEHMARVAGFDHVGLGSDFDGIEITPTGLEGVNRFPELLEELARRGWSDAKLANLAGGNLLRVLRENERVAMSMKGHRPITVSIEELDGPSETRPKRCLEPPCI